MISIIVTLRLSIGVRFRSFFFAFIVEERSIVFIF